MWYKVGWRFNFCGTIKNRKNLRWEPLPMMMLISDLLSLQPPGCAVRPSECWDCCRHRLIQTGCHGLHHLDVLLPTAGDEPQVSECLTSNTLCGKEMSTFWALSLQSPCTSCVQHLLGPSGTTTLTKLVCRFLQNRDGSACKYCLFVCFSFFSVLKYSNHKTCTWF